MTSPVGPESLGPSPPRPVLRRSMSAVDLPLWRSVSADVALSEKSPYLGGIWVRLSFWSLPEVAGGAWVRWIFGLPGGRPRTSELG
jgi:hypothetical protein